MNIKFLNSILYKERYLYSKYAADRSIKQIIQNLTILDNTLILLFSPCLWHGIIELLEKFMCSVILAIQNYLEVKRLPFSGT